MDLLQWLFRSPEQSNVQDEDVHLHDDRRIDLYVRSILTLTSVALLMLPTSVLLFVKDNNTLKYGVVLICTLVFSVVLNITTRGRRVSLMSAAYDIVSVCTDY